jgi:hypothetical protein
MAATSRNSAVDMDPRKDPKLCEVMDTDSELDLNLNYNHQKIINLVITGMKLKIHLSNIFLVRYVLKAMKTFKIVRIMK